METININKNWKFHLGECPDAWEKWYSSESWDDINIPHDWSIKQPFSRNYSSGTGYVAGGIGWYRKTFTLPDSLKGKKVWVVFDGVYKNSQVWCNSYYKGKRPSGYTTFRYDITNQVCFGEVPNTICVKVNHSDIADSRWFTGSGITRKVQIIVQDSVYIAPDGVFFKTSAVAENKAQITIENLLVNDTDEDVNVTIENVITNPDGKQAACFRKSCTIPKHGNEMVLSEGGIENPSLWSMDNPSLYTLTTKINTDNGYTDTRQDKVGVRSFLFDADKGFFLNGASLKIKGVCVHHDAGCLGAAVFRSVWVRRLKKLKEMGCNAIRMSHNPHMPELYDLCDSMGFLVIDEAFDEWEGPKNKWSTGHNAYPPKHQGYYEDFSEWHERDLKALIKRDRNHPSVFMWSIGNEIDYPNDPYCHPSFKSMTGNNDKDKPESEKFYNPKRPNAERLPVLAKMLSDIVKQEDTTRPVTAAVAFPELSTQTGFIEPLDVVGYNYKEHLYSKSHVDFPQKPFIGSENSHSFEAWLAVKNNDYISGQFLWTGIDYLGEAYGWPIRASGAGILTLAGFEKSSYYFRQSLWAQKPVLNIVTARIDSPEDEWKIMYQSWNYVPKEMVEVHCYTNISQVELFCNDRSMGVKSINNKTGYISWTLPFEEGRLTAIGIDNVSGNRLEAELETTQSATDIQISLWEDIAAPDNDNIIQIEVTVTDGHGRRVTGDSSMLHVSINNSAILLGIENGDQADLTDYSASYRRAYEGRMIIYLQRKNENKKEMIKVAVSGDGLRTAVLEI